MGRSQTTLRRLLPLLLLLGASSHAWAWGCAGHQIVAAIALLRLDPGTRAEVNAILAADPRPFGATRACPAAGLAPLVLSASWADARRNGATAPDHYVDLPLGLDRPGTARGEAEYAYERGEAIRAPSRRPQSAANAHVA